MNVKLNKILSQVLDIDEQSIDEKFSQNKCSNWDSLRHLNLIIELESEFNVSFEPEEISEMTNYKEIIRVINNKKQM